MPAPRSAAITAAIPWREEAVVIRHIGAGEREQVAQGRLWQVVEWLGEQHDRTRLTVALPDRGVRPFAFDQQQVTWLLGRTDRPRSRIGAS